tara:strand:+ start:109 stop:843 length:735 start_codon:yes stop_codon:yes gene_type:complete
MFSRIGSFIHYAAIKQADTFIHLHNTNASLPLKLKQKINKHTLSILSVYPKASLENKDYIREILFNLWSSNLLILEDMPPEVLCDYSPKQLQNFICNRLPKVYEKPRSQGEYLLAWSLYCEKHQLTFVISILFSLLERFPLWSVCMPTRAVEIMDRALPQTSSVLKANTVTALLVASTSSQGMLEGSEYSLSVLNAIKNLNVSKKMVTTCDAFKALQPSLAIKVIIIFDHTTCFMDKTYEQKTA